MNLPQFPRHSDCRLCPLATTEGINHIGIPTIHLPDSLAPAAHVPAVVFIGQNPGYEENEIGEPFVGKSGSWLREGYIDGISLRPRASVYLTNAVRCWTLNDKKPHATKHIKPCLPHTLADLKAICHAHSQVILILIGSVSAQAIWKLLGGQKKMSMQSAFKRNGSVVQWEGHTLYLFTTFHPAFLAREGGANYIHSVHNHLQLVSDLLAGTPATPSTPNLVAPFPP